jgi:hypothetical protein
MVHYSTISSKGQLTIPRRFVNGSGWKPATASSLWWRKIAPWSGPPAQRSIRSRSSSELQIRSPGGEERIKTWIDDMRSDKD